MCSDCLRKWVITSRNRGSEPSCPTCRNSIERNPQTQEFGTRCYDFEKAVSFVRDVRSSVEGVCDEFAQKTELYDICQKEKDEILAAQVIIFVSYRKYVSFALLTFMSLCVQTQREAILEEKERELRESRQQQVSEITCKVIRIKPRQSDCSALSHYVRNMWAICR